MDLENQYVPETDDANEVIYRKLREHFDGKIVRKDLTKAIKEGANVPVYVLEFLLGQYCSSDDPKIIEDGVKNVKRILSENFVRPDEAQKVLSGLRERGSYTVIDRITVSLNIKIDRYEADFSNLGVRGIPISSDYVSKYDRLLCGGIWCIIGLEYEYVEEDKKSTPIRIVKLTPIQMPHIDMDEIKTARRAFTKDEWITRLAPLHGYGSRPFLNPREMVAALPNAAAHREQLQPMRIGTPQHGQVAPLQRDFAEQHPRVRRADHGGEPLLQYVEQTGRACRSLGLRGFRRGRGHYVQGQRRRPDNEGLYGVRFLRPRQRRKGGIRVDGVRWQHQPERGCIAEDLAFV
jgi:hypothetical protein